MTKGTSKSPNEHKNPWCHAHLTKHQCIDKLSNNIQRATPSKTNFQTEYQSLTDSTNYTLQMQSQATTYLNLHNIYLTKSP